MFDDERLSRRARLAIDRAVAEGQQIAVSAWTLSEIVYLVENPVFEFPDAFDRIAAAVADPFSEIVEVPVTLSVTSRMRDFSRKAVPDPADRIIAATAMTLQVPLITKDRKIRKLATSEPGKLTTIW